MKQYQEKKKDKVKPAAKSIVTLDVKPWGTYRNHLLMILQC